MAKTLLSGMAGLGLVEASRRASQVGLSMVAAAPVAQRPDSVRASETRRRRAVAVKYHALRDRDKWDLSDSPKAILSDKVMVFRANPARMPPTAGLPAIRAARAVTKASS